MLAWKTDGEDIHLNTYMTELWFRNPHAYVREIAEVGCAANIVWDRGMLIKKRIEPVAHAKLYFGEHSDFQILAVGPQGSAHLDKDHTLDRPKAVYPTWEYGEEFNILEEMVSSPIGLDADACSANIPLDERPVVGQDHRVVIIGMPPANVAANRPFYRHLRELQEEYPECKITLHGSYSYRVMFGMGFYAADCEPRTAAANGKVYLPNGKEMAFARTIGQQQWVNLLGTSTIELKNPRPRCLFNIRSAVWAAEHFTEDINFKSQGQVVVDPDDPITKIPTTLARTQFTISPVEGDKIVCDSCSLSDECKYYREGAVCSLPQSETSSLAKMFQSRDSSKIIDGLGAVLAAQTHRLERGMESEQEFGELDPQVGKELNNVFANGIKLAKLVDPTLTKPMVQINTGAVGAVANSSPKEMIAQVIRALEADGHAREDITREMVAAKMIEMIEGPQPVTVRGELGERSA